MTRILVVDDQPNIVDMLATVLRFHGFVVDTAGTAAEALKQAAEQRPDLVLLDAMLPDGDGREVCRRLRGDGVTAGVVFLTAQDARDDQMAGLTYGGDDWITKPFDPGPAGPGNHGPARPGELVDAAVPPPGPEPAEPETLEPAAR